MSAHSVLADAEIKLLKAKRTYAKKVLSLLIEHLHYHYPEAVRLTVYAEQRTREYFIGQLLDSHDEAIELDTCLAVVAREQVEDPFGEHI